MYNSVKRLQEYATVLHAEALEQRHKEIADMLSVIMHNSEYNMRLLEVLSKPLTGYQLGLVVSARSWQT